MNITALISQINALPLEASEKEALAQSLQSKGEAALMEVLTFLELKAKNLELKSELAESISKEINEMIEEDGVDTVQAPVSA